VERALGGEIGQEAFDGAVSFDFNTGAIHRASWVRDYRSGRLTAARRGLMQWAKAGGRVVAGLVRRREAEARLIFEGDYGLPHEGGEQADAILSRDEVKTLQEQLTRLGFHGGPIDGIAGAATKAAVLAFQTRHLDLVPDGIAGPATLASLARGIAALAVRSPPASPSDASSPKQQGD
jgi:lysozyme